MKIHWMTKYMDIVAMALDEMKRGVKWCPWKKVINNGRMKTERMEPTRWKQQ